MIILPHYSQILRVLSVLIMQIPIKKAPAGIQTGAFSLDEYVIAFSASL